MKTPPAFCTGCGRPRVSCSGGCSRLLDPPRFCARCGVRLRVLVTPTRMVASCRRHGQARG